MRISILHPFTPEAVGLSEKNLPTIHSQPHIKALQMLSEKRGFECSMEYFTSKLRGYQLKNQDITYKFYPVSRKWNGDHKKWKKQSSSFCLREFSKQTPDVTIINMSGYSSPFSYELSKIIISRNKNYIAMLGGQHYSDNERNRNFYKNAHHILVHTESQKLEMLRMDLFKNLNIRVFPLGVDCSIFKPVDKMNKNPVLLFVGRIIEWKRIHLAIEAVKKLVTNGFLNAHLDIIGPVSSESYLVFLKQLVIQHQLGPNVRFLGSKEHSELIPFFQKADLLTLPSDMETFGMVMIEAMACGTPVAAINCPGGPIDVLEHGKDGVLATPENYSEEILNYFKNMDAQIEMSIKAREKVEEHYSLNATYVSLEKSINSVLTTNN